MITKKKGRPHIAKDDTWTIEFWGELRAAGFTAALGFVPSDVAIFAEQVEATFANETELAEEAHVSPFARCGRADGGSGHAAHQSVCGSLS